MNNQYRHSITRKWSTTFSMMTIIASRGASGFLTAPRCESCKRASSLTVQSNQFDDDLIGNIGSTDSFDLKGFNPLDYQNSQTRISLRKMQMSDLTSQLMGVVGDTEATQAILNDFKMFLLEPCLLYTSPSPRD